MKPFVARGRLFRLSAIRATGAWYACAMAHAQTGGELAAQFSTWLGVDGSVGLVTTRLVGEYMLERRSCRTQMRLARLLFYVRAIAHKTGSELRANSPLMVEGEHCSRRAVAVACNACWCMLTMVIRSSAEGVRTLFGLACAHLN